MGNACKCMCSQKVDEGGKKGEISLKKMPDEKEIVSAVLMILKWTRRAITNKGNIQNIELARFTHNADQLSSQIPMASDNIKKLPPFAFNQPLESGLILKEPAKLENGAIYSGYWKDNLRHGKGVQQWVDGSIYFGYWKNDQTNGKGRLVHADEDVYEGTWLNDKADGYGTYIHNDGAKYIGGWSEDRQHGKGVEEWMDGAKYAGDYFQGKKHGKGKFTWSDKSEYEEDFTENNIQGVGKYI